MQNDPTPVLVFSEDDLPALAQDLGRFGFPPETRFTSLALGRLDNELRLHFGTLPASTAPRQLYEAINRLARHVDDDCRQMGHVAPLTILITPPQGCDAAALKSWSQIDTDTDTNPGEFIVRLRSTGPTEKYAPTSTDPMVADGFESMSLHDAIRPRSEEDYRKALLRAEDEAQLDPIYRQLLHAGLSRYWAAPQELRSYLSDWVHELASRSAQPAADSNAPDSPASR